MSNRQPHKPNRMSTFLAGLDGLQCPRTPAKTPVKGPLKAPASPVPASPSSAPSTAASLAQARLRLDAVALAERLAATGLARAEADTKAAGQAGVTPRTVRRWRLACRGLAPEARPAALTDRPGRGRCGPLTGGQMRDCVEAMIYEHGPHLTASHAVRVLAARYGKAPSLRAVQRWLKAWRADPKNAWEVLAVDNPDAWRSRCQPALGDGAAGVASPNDRWEFDSTRADVMCTDGRYTIVAVIDVWTRRAKVLVVPTSRATAICALLRRCLIDWGVPETVRTDEGADYTSKHLRRVLKDLGISHDVCPPYAPEAKPYIERFFGTLTRGLFAKLPGFTGHNVADRKRIEAKKSFAARRGDDDRETFDVQLTGAELQARCDTWCEAIYGHDVHSGTGESPFARWQGWTAPLRRIEDPRALDPLLAEPVSASGDGPRRTIRKQGIIVGGRRYIAAEMGRRIGERVEVRLDPADPARLFVFALDGTFLFMAEDPERTGADLTRIASEAKADARDAGREAREKARDLARSHKPKKAMDDVLKAAERAADNVIALPRPTDPHETPALAEARRAADAAERADEGTASEPTRARSKRRTVADVAAQVLLDGEHDWNGGGSS